MKSRIIKKFLAAILSVGMLSQIGLPAVYGEAMPGDTIKELWVGETQVIRENIVTDDKSGDGWEYNSTTNTLTMNGANIKPFHTIASIYGGNDLYGIYCDGNLDIVLEGEENIINPGWSKAEEFVNGIGVNGNLSISGSGN